jgi:uncharacterized FlaG/YvyC family protein
MDTAATARATTPAWAPAAERKPKEPIEATELPKSEVVRPAVDTRDIDRVEVKRRALVERELEAADRRREVVTREDARGTVFRVSDASSGAVVYQIPSEEALKLRAYRETQDRAREERAVEREREERVELSA